MLFQNVFTQFYANHKLHLHVPAGNINFQFSFDKLYHKGYL